MLSSETVSAIPQTMKEKEQISRRKLRTFWRMELSWTPQNWDGHVWGHFLVWAHENSEGSGSNRRRPLATGCPQDPQSWHSLTRGRFVTLWLQAQTVSQNTSHRHGLIYNHSSKVSGSTSHRYKNYFTRRYYMFIYKPSVIFTIYSKYEMFISLIQ